MDREIKNLVIVSGDRSRLEEPDGLTKMMKETDVGIWKSQREESLEYEGDDLKRL